jgi:cyclopropane fatty-acyl-phospholipid synthase-like methyltransferase
MKNKILKYKNIIYVIVIILLIQIISTLLTNTKEFSIQAFLRNLVWGYAFYQIYYTKNILWLFVPLLFNILLNIIFFWIIPFKVFKSNNFKLQPWITTKYLYNDFFENIVKDNKSLEFYTEGTYGELLNCDVLNISKKNTDIIMKWGEKQYNNGFDNKPIVDFNGKPINTENIQYQAEINKFKWIVNNLNITSNSKVLELGFGKIDLMKYIRDNTGATVEGTNISEEQIKNAKDNGFNTYKINHNDLYNYLNILGKYDVIISNGSLEYLQNSGDEKIFSNFVKNINKLLNKGGKWYTTTIHINMNWCINNIFNINNYNLYNLGFGNEGCYPIYPDGLTKYAKNNNLNIIKQETRWLDYYIYSILWFINHKKTYKNNIKNIIKHINAYIAAPNYLESYLCYTPFKNMYHLQPWLWQFTKQKNKCIPTLHQWIIFEKQ